MGAANMNGPASHSTTTTADTPSKLQNWKARFASGRRRSGSDMENYVEHADSVAANNNASLSNQRNKTKKNWKGNLKNFLPNQKKDNELGSSNPQTADALVEGTQDVSCTVFLICRFSLIF
jgi:hypothetical protein